ncbi:hypothetical protein TI39_contig341g00009 [Zymoseptoria brevis]|uniref:Uncharacterized protein n=1 Tax=Zymoseptoria brevis TaxID=1047168 RepID=A0A0F4GSY2_9PEZI|nr:hypothetical protein TI39_contig341g00009 [Zymoseptoria brevis]
MASDSPSSTPQPRASDDAPQDNQKIQTGLRKRGREEDTAEEHGKLAVKTIDNKKRVGLLDLPAELWSRIGKMAVDMHPETEDYYRNGCCYKALMKTPQSISTDANKFPPVTQICASMRDELLPYYYDTKLKIETTLRYQPIQCSKNLARLLRSIEPRHLHRFTNIKIVGAIDDQAHFHVPVLAHHHILQVAGHELHGNDILGQAPYGSTHCPDHANAQSIVASFPSQYRFTHFLRLLFQLEFDVVLEREDRSPTWRCYEHRIVFPKILDT